MVWGPPMEPPVRRLPALVLPVAVLLGGCKAVDPAPRELDDLLHWFWQKYADGTDEELAEGAVNLYDAVDAASFEELSDGSISDLDRDEAALVGITDQDPAEAAGVYLVNVYDCTLPKLEPILLHRDQATLYDGIYDRYERTYTASRDDFEGRASPTMTWDVEYEASLLGAAYTANLEGGLRYVPTLDDELSPHGPVMLSRTHLLEPVTYDGDSNKSQEQDYQVEIYLKQSSGRVLHVYGLWREADYGGTTNSDNEGVQRLLLNSLADWDATTEQHCADGI